MTIPCSSIFLSISAAICLTAGWTIAAVLDLDSPAVLLPPPAPTPHDDELSEMPLPKEGLTDKQRLEVLRLLSNVLGGGNTDNTGNEG